MRALGSTLKASLWLDPVAFCHTQINAAPLWKTYFFTIILKQASIQTSSSKHVEYFSKRVDPLKKNPSKMLDVKLFTFMQ